MVFDDKRIININTTIPVLLMSITSVMLFTYLYLRSGNLDSIARLNAPQGQTLYVLSKLTALGVYLLLWWQIILGIFKGLSRQYHIISGFSVLLLVITHVALFISAVSMRQGELVTGMLLPDFTSGYYQNGLSLGAIALLCIIIVSVSGVLRSRFSRRWRLGHSLVYLTFIFATIHGFMIGSDISSELFSYFIYMAVVSIFLALIFKQLIWKKLRTTHN